MNGVKLCCIYILIVCGLLWQGVAARAGSNEEQLFQQAGEAYSRGDYDQAIAHYEEITAAAGFSPSVLYNLASSYAQSGKIGRAVLNYERALRLAPGDSDITGNLELVRKESGLFETEMTGAERFIHLLSLHQWAILGLSALIGFTLFQATTMRYAIGAKTRAGVRIACALVFCLAAGGAAGHYQHFNPAVVVAADARLLISPFASAASVGAIPEGRLVYPQKNHGAFTLVRDETTRHGWIVSSNLEAVVR